MPAPTWPPKAYKNWNMRWSSLHTRGQSMVTEDVRLIVGFLEADGVQCFGRCGLLADCLRN